MKTKHTKGEWEYKYNSIYAKKINGKSFEVCRFHGYSAPGMNHDLEANAKLIASAPDLLEALIELYNSLPDGYESECLPKVRNAIKKATE